MGEAIDRPRIEAAVRELLLAIGEDPERPGLERTPERVAESYRELFGGLARDPVAELGDPVPLGATDAGGATTSDTVIVRDLAFRSVCEHHLLPFLGTAHVAYVPDGQVVGLGRIPAAIDALAARPQVQERLAEEVADALEGALAPHGVLVVLDAVHGCVTSRGPRQTGSSTVTVVARGLLAEPARRAEAIALIGGRADA
ncbi:GTP cyclohydrolase 1 [Agromyces rhizosphaerae]|uniref:GTP cyclohydrolase 1 n=1 Tax=Agromyces rhizosphaerae TaxID=88374 RepID=A0A9W6CW31_9MICO|nr:GTP cyclohydrolase I [Agromyces rhizosphaerae]GLI27859.1 GTP cyclohydrolase 1 [Agromyces rhizosphaerae]